MQRGYLDVDAQLASHPDIERVTARFWVVIVAVVGGMLLALLLVSVSLALQGRGFAAVAVLPVGLVLTVLMALLLGWTLQVRGDGARPRGDRRNTWRIRSTGSPITRVWSEHWDLPPENHAWLYGELGRGNLDALLRLGPAAPWNFGEVYLALYAAPHDRVAYLVMSTKTGERLGADTGWRPIELRGHWYDYAVARLHY